MLQHSQVQKKSKYKTKVPLDKRLLRYLNKHIGGVSVHQLYAWINSCTFDCGYTIKDFDCELITLRDSGKVCCTNGIFYLRNNNTNKEK